MNHPKLDELLGKSVTIVLFVATYHGATRIIMESKLKGLFTRNEDFYGVVENENKFYFIPSVYYISETSNGIGIRLHIDIYKNS